MAYDPKYLDDIVDSLNEPHMSDASNTKPPSPPISPKVGSKSPISLLQEYLQKSTDGPHTPDYELIAEEGRGFRFRVSVLGHTFEDTACYPRKQNAKESVARLALASGHFGSYDLESLPSSPPLTAPSRPFTPAGINPVKLQTLLSKRQNIRPTSLLNEYTQLARLPQPEYNLSNDDNGLYLCKLHIGNHVFEAPKPEYHLHIIKDTVSNIALEAFLNSDSLLPSNQRSPTTTNENTSTSKSVKLKEDLLFTADRKYVSRLLEHCQQKKWPLPKYEYEGPPLKTGFVCNVTLDTGTEKKVYRGTRRFPKKADAKEDTSKIAFEGLRSKGG